MLSVSCVPCPPVVDTWCPQYDKEYVIHMERFEPGAQFKVQLVELTVRAVTDNQHCTIRLPPLT